MNDIVKFESEKGQLVQFTAADVKARLCPNIEDKELALVMALCQAQRLNPFIKDVYIIKYGSQPAAIVTSKEVFTKRANSNPNYRGFEAGVTFIDGQGQVRQREGSAVYAEANEKLVGGWCRVYVEGKKPFYDEVSLAEYSTGKSGWAKMPSTMVRKVALVHCLREAFPEDFQGLYSEEEMGTAGDSAARMAADPVPQPAPVEFVEMMNDEQADRLQFLSEEFAELRNQPVSAVYEAVMKSKAAQQAGVKAGQEWTAQQAATIIGLLEKWVEKAAADRAAQEYELDGIEQAAINE